MSKLFMKIKDIKKIVFVLENKALIVFELEDFIKIRFHGVHKIDDDEYYADEIEMILKKSANKKSKYDLYRNFKLRQPLFDEIIYIPNIMEIEFHLNNDDIITIYPEYDDHSYSKDGSNTFQIGSIDKNGNLIISIKER